MPTSRFDPSQLNHIALETFRSHFVPASQLETGETHGGKAFRQVNKRKLSDELPKRSEPLSLNGYIMSGGALNIEVQEVTPEQAKVWLERGGVNRKPTERLVARLAAAIRRGEWQLTGDSVKLDEEGQVIDGQHRLLAIIEAGIPVTTLIARGVARSAMDVIDTGRVRQANDVLSLHGYANTMALAACCRALLLLEHFGRYNITGRQVSLVVTNTTILRYATEHPEAGDGVRLAENARRNGLAGGTGLLGACLTLFLRLDAAAAEWFAAALGSGANLDEDSPILRLRNRLSGRDYGIIQDSKGREQIMALVIKAWNTWRRGESVRALVWRETDDFPVAE